MKKALYFTYEDFEDDKTSLGVLNKITGQINAFKVLGYEVDMICKKNQDYHFNEQKIIKNQKHRKLQSYQVKNFLSSKNLIYDIAYVRGGVVELPTYFVLFNHFKKISKDNLYFEVPTYPYYSELSKTFRFSIRLFFHRISVLFRKSYVKKVVTTQFHDKIWGVPTIKIVNAIDTTLPGECSPKAYQRGEDLQLITVANISFWHGYDRLLYGLYDYYKSQYVQKVYLTIIGEGKEKDKLIEITKKQKLEQYVTFLPAMFGESLQKEYAKAHVGIGTLGLYRKHLSYTSCLKSIEYLYKGIPFVSGYIDPKFQGKDFYKLFSNDDTPIDINELIRWRDSVKTSPEQMNRLAVEKYSWIRQMKKIVKDN